MTRLKVLTPEAFIPRSVEKRWIRWDGQAEWHRVKSFDWRVGVETYCKPLAGLAVPFDSRTYDPRKSDRCLCCAKAYEGERNGA